MNFTGINNSDLNDNDKQIVARVLDFVKICSEKNVVKFTGFLDLRQQKLVLSVLNSLQFHRYIIYGGYDEAERKILCVYGEYCTVSENDYCFDCLEFIFKKEYSLLHRDFLGSLMSQQIKREMIGDIIVSEGVAYAFVCKTVSSIIVSDINKIGSVGVKIAVVSNPVISKKQDFKEIKGTVSSLRLDSIVSLALNISREKSSQLIKSKGIEVNYCNKYAVDTVLKSDDVFSVRGYGKFILHSVDGKTKKDRIHITIKKYI